jgi:DNA-binding LytR/AlgR family response regulator
MIRIVIIEDERLIAEELGKRLRNVSKEITIEKVLTSVRQGVDYFSAINHPDLIFSDIQLADGLSFEIFNKARVNVPVVFLTAFEKFIVNAFEYNSIDYLLKPVEDKELEKVLEKYNQLGQHFNRRNEFFESFSRSKKRLIVKKGLVNVALKLDEIVLFFTEDKVSYAVDRSGKKYVCEKNLTELEEMLAVAGFFRANRQYIVNAEYIRGYKSYNKVKLVIDLSVPVTENLIIVSQETAPHFRRWMSEI